MATPGYIEKFGNQLRLVNDDGTAILAYPTQAGIFIMQTAEPPPEPGPEPAPGMFSWPLPLSTVSSEYGPRSGGYSSVHQGIDLAPSAGTPIANAGTGVVYQNRWHNNFGNMVIMRHDGVGGSTAFLVYAHMQAKPGHGEGATLAKGVEIGKVGNTGASFGAHLHFETHLGGLNWNNPGTHMNPRIFIERYGA